MKKKNWLVILLIVGISITAFPSLILAWTWTAAGSAGTVDEENIDDFVTNLSYLYFKPDVTGTIIVRYNVTNPFDLNDARYHWDTLYVSFVDPGDASRILVYLRSMDLETGTPTRIAAFNSDDFPASDLVQLHHIPVTGTFDFESNVYYLEVVLYRKLSTARLGIFGLKLDYYAEF